MALTLAHMGLPLTDLTGGPGSDLPREVRIDPRTLLAALTGSNVTTWDVWKEIEIALDKRVGSVSAFPKLARMLREHYKEHGAGVPNPALSVLGEMLPAGTVTAVVHGVLLAGPWAPTKPVPPMGQPRGRSPIR